MTKSDLKKIWEKYGLAGFTEMIDLKTKFN